MIEARNDVEDDGCVFAVPELPPVWNSGRASLRIFRWGSRLHLGTGSSVASCASVEGVALVGSGDVEYDVCVAGPSPRPRWSHLLREVIPHPRVWLGSPMVACFPRAPAIVCAVGADVRPSELCRWRTVERPHRFDDHALAGLVVPLVADERLVAPGQIEHDVGVASQPLAAVVTGAGEVSTVDDLFIVGRTVEEPLRGSLVQLRGHQSRRLRSLSASPSPRFCPVLHAFAPSRTAPSTYLCAARTVWAPPICVPRRDGQHRNRVACRSIVPAVLRRSMVRRVKSAGGAVGHSSSHLQDSSDDG